MTQSHSLFTEYDIDLFKAGQHYRLYEKMGAHDLGDKGVYFAVWAPNAQKVSVIGSFNNWQKDNHPLFPRWDHSGIWEGLIKEAAPGQQYKFHIIGNSGYEVEKADPFAFKCEIPPATASIIHQTTDDWNDEIWMQSKAEQHITEQPLAIYELHIGSWRRGDGFLSYKDLSMILPDYCQYMGFTHVEFLPIMAHPFYGSWGYQITGYYATDSRYGDPEDLKFLIDQLHQAGIGVILDWVPSHFPTDVHGLALFDGTHLYEHEDPRKGFHPDWKSAIFNYNRNEVRSFLISNALYWLDRFHVDGLRMDAVASMLYLDYSREPGEWIPNEYGGRENLEAVRFLKDCNNAIHTHYPKAFTIAEESTSWPGVTRSTAEGGLGFDLKWMMGWMNDTLRYFEKDPIYRSHHHGSLLFSIHYAFTERFCLPLSHDEVVHGKKSLISKMPGDEWQQFANLRLLYSYMYAHPGAKLLFMGAEFGQRHEWRHDFSLDWHENHNPFSKGIQEAVRTLNHLYRSENALWEQNYQPEGFVWLDISNADQSVLIWMRKGLNDKDFLIIAANFTPVPRFNYRIGVPEGSYLEIYNSDSHLFGGSGIGNSRLKAYPIERNGVPYSISVTLPPLAMIILKPIHTNDRKDPPTL